jgi:hypothetical protein
MMMRALHHGGLPVIELQKEANSVPDLNPSGLYEVGRGFYMNPYFLRNIPDNSLIKILFDGLCYLPQGDYKIIFMVRDEQDINASVQRAEKQLRASGIPENDNIPTPFDVYRPYKQDDIDHVINICEVRGDIELIRVHYNDVLDNPIGVFESLHLPIDVDKAVKVINPQLCRFRNEYSSRRDSRWSPDSKDLPGTSKEDIRRPAL